MTKEYANITSLKGGSFNLIGDAFRDALDPKMVCC